ncbi:site-specific integrase [Mycolicibacterium sp. 018/SC-01/001]|uniref:tyrosine-type recombinase/integrase n=1 Tax=Mycolicibacterium sp. 018/SC-01/001 TaxID=2592069 RepID=UPI00117D1E9A|nr:site-specific integrase [Mycolicibacterium sp. 018/SC-01/001]TRW81243.1 site-specific integrase [Mycolicibacterium sp. 018/SC-01/001]
MASLRAVNRKNGTEYVQVLYRLDGRQTSTSFEDLATAIRFKELVEKFGAAQALTTLGTDPDMTTMTVREWIEHHIEHLTGLRKSTLWDYQSYLHKDIGPSLGDLPLTGLTREHIAKWTQDLADGGASGKTISNKHGFLSSALNAAVRAGRIRTNPALGQRLPTSERPDMVCLSHEDFARLLANVTDHWKPLVEFLVASGCRWGEATALRPSDIDLATNTVRITRSWKRTYDRGGYELGPPKTKKSVRTINVPRATLDKLDLTGEWVFRNKAGTFVKGNGFHDRVWSAAVERTWPTEDAEGKPIKAIPDAPILKPRIHDLRHTCASWLVLAGVPLPVIQEHLGHESINTTISLYSHIDRRSMSVAADAIGAALGG